MYCLGQESIIYELILSGLGFFTLPETTVSFSGLSKLMPRPDLFQ